jgi:hypothetical protein
MHFLIRAKYHPFLMLITSSTCNEYLSTHLKGRKASAHRARRTSPCLPSSSRNLVPSFHFTFIFPFPFCTIQWRWNFKSLFHAVAIETAPPCRGSAPSRPPHGRFSTESNGSNGVTETLYPNPLPIIKK